MTVVAAEAAAPAIEGAEGATAAGSTGSSSSGTAAGAASGGKPKAGKPAGPKQGAGQLDELISQPKRKQSRSRQEPPPSDEEEDQEDEEESSSRRSPYRWGRDFLSYRRTSPIETGSGFLLGAILWALAVNWVRGGQSQALAWIKAKGVNETSQGAPNLIPLAPFVPNQPSKPGGGQI